jgi:hypothetical protein
MSFCSQLTSITLKTKMWAEYDQELRDAPAVGRIKRGHGREGHLLE